MDRVGEEILPRYGRKVRLCPFDQMPCCRPPSPIDGDFQCGGMYYCVDFNRPEDEVEIVPPCPRLDPQAIW